MAEKNAQPASKTNRPNASPINALGYKSLLTFTILALACIAGFASRLFAVIRFESIIHEFDPWYDLTSMIQIYYYNLTYPFQGLITEQQLIWSNMGSTTFLTGLTRGPGTHLDALLVALFTPD